MAAEAKCPDCQRKLRKLRVRGASYELEQALRASARVCWFCTTAGLLAGGFVPNGFPDDWTEEEQALLQSRAASIRAEKQKPKPRKRAEAKLAEPEKQEALV